MKARVAETADEPTGAAYIFVNDQTGDNAIIVVPGAGGSITPADVDAVADTIRSSAVFVTQLEQPVDAAKRGLEIAQAAGVVTVFNPAPAVPVDDAIYPLCDYVTPNENEATLLSGVTVKTVDDARKAGDVFLKKGVGAALITLGEAGRPPPHGFGLDAGPRVQGRPRRRNDRRRRRLQWRIRRRRSHEALVPREAVRFGCAVAGISVTRAGTAPSMPKLAEVEALLAQNPLVSLTLAELTCHTWLRGDLLDHNRPCRRVEMLTAGRGVEASKHSSTTALSNSPIDCERNGDRSLLIANKGGISSETRTYDLAADAHAGEPPQLHEGAQRGALAAGHCVSALGIGWQALRAGQSSAPQILQIPGVGTGSPTDADWQKVGELCLGPTKANVAEGEFAGVELTFMGLNNQNLHNVLFRGFLKPWEAYTGAKINWIDLAQADYNPRLQQSIATGTVDFDILEMGAPVRGRHRRPRPARRDARLGEAADRGGRPRRLPAAAGRHLGRQDLPHQSSTATATPSRIARTTSPIRRSRRPPA